ncbi:uncharacterized protein MELLADRAFT_114563 [Melampsora larici-populina 98AG31]|uniref:Uncharacterized protein n=1 Tax=Melampsora larici-populina (strain 98AG31 / pathotype 3-4-7) TaxID=747676 RepID=F4SDY8_MELLP|nr:uncharacterized protein MELLADRAFT_114563 [Melampsora larici-populina 98AG31]EGF97137.1 hypothetical protein MELLADRAFT_114563 [Melampsora larici-populina 98AG31]
MAAQEFADECSNRELENRNKVVGTSRDEVVEEQIGENSKGKKNQLRNDDIQEDGRRTEEMKGNSGQQKNISSVLDSLIISPVTNPMNDQRRRDETEDVVNVQGTLTGLGRVAETSNNSTFIELTHKKWIHNLQSAVLKSNLVQFNVLNQEYQKWCGKEGTSPREIELYDLDFDTIMESPTVVDKSENTVDAQEEIVTGRTKAVHPQSDRGMASGVIRNGRGGYKGQFYDPNYQRNQRFSNSQFGNQNQNFGQNQRFSTNNNHGTHPYNNNFNNGNFGNNNGHGTYGRGSGSFMRGSGHGGQGGGRSFAGERPAIGVGSFHRAMAQKPNTGKSNGSGNGQLSASGSK